MTDERQGWTSASNAAADAACPGRHRAQVGLKDLPRQPETEAGEIIHALWTADPTVSQGRGDDAGEQAGELRRNEDLAVDAFLGQTATTRHVETRLWHEFETESGETLKHSGRFDVARLSADHTKLLILDGKTGWLEVEANPRNLQLRDLAALAFLNLPQLESVGVAILKPHGKPSDICEYDRKALRRAVSEMEARVKASHDPNGKRIPGEDQCRYCKAKEVCKERLDWLAAALPEIVPPLPLVSARDWSPQQRAVFCERKAAAAKWLDDRNDEIKALLTEDPRSVPGFTLKPGRTQETITNSQEVFNRFCVNIGGKPEQFMPAVKIAKGAFKDQVRAVTGHKGKALEQDVASLLDGCTESKECAPTIVKVAK